MDLKRIEERAKIEITTDDELTCIKCGSTYTMSEFRVWRWVAHSDLCIDCDDVAFSKMLHALYGMQLGRKK